MRQPELIERGLRLRSLPWRLLRFCARPPGSQLPPPSPWAVMSRPFGAKTRRPPLWFVAGWSRESSWRRVLSFDRGVRGVGGVARDARVPVVVRVVDVDEVVRLVLRVEREPEQAPLAAVVGQVGDVEEERAVAAR